MSCWEFLCGPASPEAPANFRKYQQHQCRWLRHGSARKRTAARGLAEVCTPHVVVALRISRAEPFAPDSIVGGVDNTVAAKIAGSNSPSAEVRAPQIVLCRGPIRVLPPQDVIGRVHHVVAIEVTDSEAPGHDLIDFAKTQSVGSAKVAHIHDVKISRSVLAKRRNKINCSNVRTELHGSV